MSLIDTIDPAAVRIAVGMDNGYVKTETGYAAYAAVAVSLLEQDVLEVACGSAPLTFPYIPAFLTFREAPAILAALDVLRAEPDVLLFDGQGYAHSRRFGLASHLSVVLGRPTIGCAKSRLVGEYGEPADEAGAWSPLVEGNETVGTALRTQPGHDPLFGSPEHMISVETAVAVVRACCRDGTFLPVPIRVARDSGAAYTKPLRGKRTKQR